jgi:predicted metalloendopeptidase
MERIRLGPRLGALAIACASILSGIDPACATGTPVPDTRGHVRPQDNLYLADFFRDPDFVRRASAIVVDDKPPAGPPEPTRSVDDKLRAILEGAASTQQPPGTRLQLLGDFYASYTDAESIERLGVQPLESLFARIDAIHHARDLGALFGDLGTLNVPTPIVASSNARQGTAHACRWASRQATWATHTCRSPPGSIPHRTGSTT